MMVIWRVLADVVMYLHIFLPLLFIGVVAVSLFREVGFQWRLLCYVGMGMWVSMEIAPKFGWTKNCPLTDLEYSLRRLGLHPYDWTDEVRRVWQSSLFLCDLSNSSSNSFGER